MIEYNKVNVKWSDSQLNKLKSTAEKQTGVTLRMNIVPLGITAVVSAIDAEMMVQWFWNNNFNNFKWRNKWHNENCSSSWRF